MSAPTAAEAAAKELANITGDHPWHKHFHTCVRVLDALGIDPDSPLSLLHWHATQAETERCARIAENAGRANGQWIADEIRRSDRL